MAATCRVEKSDDSSRESDDRSVAAKASIAARRDSARPKSGADLRAAGSAAVHPLSHSDAGIAARSGALSEVDSFSRVWQLSQPAVRTTCRPFSTFPAGGGGGDTDGG